VKDLKRTLKIVAIVIIAIFVALIGLRVFNLASLVVFILAGFLVKLVVVLAIAAGVIFCLKQRFLL